MRGTVEYVVTAYVTFDKTMAIDECYEITTRLAALPSVESSHFDGDARVGTFSIDSDYKHEFHRELNKLL